MDEVKVCGAVQSWFTLKYATEEGRTVAGIPDTMFTPARLVMPDPLPEMVPTLTTRFEDIVTEDIKVCPAVQVLVELSSVLTLAGFTQLGAAPEPLDCRICRDAPDPLLPIRAPATTRFDDTVTAWLLAPNDAALATVMDEVKVCGAV